MVISNGLAEDTDVLCSLAALATRELAAEYNCVA